MGGTQEKILDLDRLREELERVRKGRKVVHCHGVFDVLHLGHIRHFRAARKLGDILVVTITPDEFVNKGPHRPVFNSAQRAEVLAALAEVDYVAVNRWPTAVETIRLVKPDFYVKGQDYRDAKEDISGKILDEEEAVRSVGGEIRFTEDITFSSSTLANQCFSPFPKEVQEFLANFSRQYTHKDLLDHLERMRPLRVLTVGETIIDEYHFCETLGKSGKEPILAAKFLWSERFAGGILAIANHVAAFADQVGVVSAIGKVDSHLDFIKENLRKNITTHFLPVPNAPTMVKRRFVERYPFQKLFETYQMNGDECGPEKSLMLRRKLEETLPGADVVIVADYGHGMIDEACVRLLCDKARFLVINAQLNAGNQGFHAFSKYPRADLISISENELRMEARSRTADIEELILRASEKASCGKILITQGEQGCLCYGKGEGFSRIPAFTRRVVDRIGAGDAVLSIASLSAALDLPMEMTGFFGSVVGAQAVQTMCNRSFLDKLSFSKALVSLLK